MPTNKKRACGMQEHFVYLIGASGLEELRSSVLAYGSFLSPVSLSHPPHFLSISTKLCNKSCKMPNIKITPNNLKKQPASVLELSLCSMIYSKNTTIYHLGLFSCNDAMPLNNLHLLICEIHTVCL